jgi:hypothetical protein
MNRFFLLKKQCWMIIAGLALSACGTGGSVGENQPTQSVGSVPTPAPTTNNAPTNPTAQPDGAANPTVQPSGAGAHEVTMIGREYAFEAPEKVPAGLLNFTFQNQGAAVHHAQIARLNDGVTFDKLMAAFKQGETAALPLITVVGGPSLIDPGTTARVTLDLKPGAYALLCLVPDAEGIPHLAHGMARPLTITGDATAQPEPQADLTISMADFQYSMPGEVDSGPQVWKVVNDGVQPHELVLHKLAPGKTAEDIIAFFHHPQGQPPFTNAGGMQGLLQGGAGWAHLDLEPGTYVAICYSPDPASGKRHMDLGMVKTLSVVSES